MKYLRCIVFTLFLVITDKSVIAAPVLYVFEGTVSDFRSYHQDYDIDDFNLTVGETSLKYVFVVDLEAENSTFTNTRGTWHYFYSDLVSGSMINSDIRVGNYSGFDWYSLNISNTGQITSKIGDVRITTNASRTNDWRVKDWMIGQTFRSTDGACFRGGSGSGCAVYAFGDVTLTSITAVPLPGAILFFVSSLIGIGLTKKCTNRAVACATVKI